MAHGKHRTDAQFPGYELDRTTRVWVSPRHKAFAYSDGDTQENYVLEAVRSAKDVSSASDELPAKARDWASEYHLTPARGNLVAPLELHAGMRVLELGCGMGAITRRLGETGATVVAIEGSMRRASIARERCRDLGNVQVVCDNFKEFQASEKFDVVTLIGVMEYSPRFIGGDDPIGACLALARSHLRPEGTLVIAIENRLGLKYWNNCVEDHTGIAFDSIHDTYRPNWVATFGHDELREVVGKAGFSEVDFLLPFPDYKVPTAVVRESALSDRAISFSSIVGPLYARDYHGEKNRHFSERLALKTLEKNGLVAHFSNSFLCLCRLSKAGTPLVTAPWAAKIYNTGRRACYRTKTTVFREPVTGEVRVLKERLHPEAPLKAGPLKFDAPLSDPYVSGTLLSDELYRTLFRATSLSGYFQKLCEYKDAVIALSQRLRPDLPAQLCAGELVDATPFNLIRTASGALELIDHEWSSSEPVPLKFVLLRGLLAELSAKTRYIESGAPFASYGTLRALAEAAFSAMGLSLSDADIDHYAHNEAAIQQQAIALKHDHAVMTQAHRSAFASPLGQVLHLTQRVPLAEVARLLVQQQKAAREVEPPKAQQQVASPPSAPKRTARDSVAEGEALFVAGDVAKAKRAMEEALKAEPEYPDALNNLGCIALAEGDSKLAREMFERGLRKNARHLDLLANYGHLLSMSGEHAAALPHLRTLAELASSSTTVLNLYAGCLAENDSFEEAELVYQRSLSLDEKQDAVREILVSFKALRS
jgi:Tfp pilus assembly protein PilF/SAM-dependent methyltransferase